MSIPGRLVRSGGRIVVSWPDPESRETCVRNDLTQRLKGVCDRLSSAEFEALVVTMTREQLKRERIHERRIDPS